MKIAVPTANGKLAAHFGHCEQFTVVLVDQQKNSVVSSEALTPPPHEPGLLPRWLKEQDVDIIIAGGMGIRAQNLFAGDGIKVVVGAPIEEPEKLVEQYLAGTLRAGANLCDH